MTIEEFKKVDLRVARVVTAEQVKGSEKLIKLQVLAGDKDEAGQEITRQIVAGIGKMYTPEALIGTSLVVVANLDPRKLMGLESQGMILAAHDKEGNPVLIEVSSAVPAGSKIS